MSNTLDLGSFYFSKGKILNFTFDSLDLSNLHYYYLSCGSCTEVTEVNIEKGLLKGVINVGDALGSAANTNGEYPITKSIYLKLDKNKSEYIPDNNFKRVYNQDVDIVTLNIKFLVRVLNPEGS